MTTALMHSRPTTGSWSAVVAFVFIAVVVSVHGSSSVSETTPELDGTVVVVSDGVSPLTGVCVDVGADEDRDNVTNRDDGEDIARNVRSASRLMDTLIGSEFNTSSCVITITRGHVAQVIVDVLRHMKVPVVEMVSGDVVIRRSSGPNHYIVPHYAYWQIQNVLLFSRVSNWTALAVAYRGQGSETERVARELFKLQAFEKGVCVLTASSNSVPLVVFHLNSISGDLNLTPLPTEYRTVLFVGEAACAYVQTVSTMFTDQQFILSLCPSSGRWSLVEGVINACNSTSINYDTVYQNQEFQDACLNFISLNLTAHSVKSFTESFFSSVSFLISLTYDFSYKSLCNESRSTLECLLFGNAYTVLDDSSNLIHTTANTFEMQYSNKNNETKNEGYLVMNDGGYTLFVPKVLPHQILNKNCGDLCYKCLPCYPSGTSETKVMTSGDGDAFIVGFFPVHLSNKHGFCSEPNPRGYAAALMFLEVIKSFYSNRSFWNTSTIQGVVFDSCASYNEVVTILHTLETCASSFKETVNGIQITKSLSQSSVVGYVDGMNDFDLSSLRGDKVLLSIQSFGYSTSLNFKKIFVENVLVTLSKIGWTVVNVIITNREPFLTFAQLLHSSPLSSSFCFADEIVVRSGAVHQDHDLNETVRSKEKTPAFLMLTSYEDTVEFVKHHRVLADMTGSKVSLVLFPWNWHLRDMEDLWVSIDVTIEFRASVEPASNNVTDSINNMLQSTPTPWRQEFHNFSTTPPSVENLSLIVQGVTSFLRSLDVMSLGGNKEVVHVRQTGLNVTATYVKENYETDIAFVDTVFMQKVPYDGPIYNVCRSWCPGCNLCKPKDVATPTKLYLDGDLLITGVFSLHKTGVEPFTCGDSQDDVDQIMKVQAFLFAVQSAQERYPDLLPGLRIGGLILDSCSSFDTAIKVISEFESCARNCEYAAELIDQDKQNNHSGNPKKNLAYIIDSYENSESLRHVMSRFHNTVFMTNVAPVSNLTNESTIHFIHVTVQVLISAVWKKFIILTNKLEDFENEVNELVTEARNFGLCAVTRLLFNISDFDVVISRLEQYQNIAVVLLSTPDVSEIIFDSLKTRNGSYFWIIPAIHESWEEYISRSEHFPLGSVIIDLKSREKNVNLRQKEQFNEFLLNTTKNPKFLSSVSSWYKDLWRMRFSCDFSADSVQGTDAKEECPATAPVSDTHHVVPDVYNVIAAIDAVLHRAHELYVSRCPELAGICDRFSEDVASGNTSFVEENQTQHQGEQLTYIPNRESPPELSIFNYQRNGAVKVGSYVKSTLSLNVTDLRLYAADGTELNYMSKTVCVTGCECLAAPSSNDSGLKETRAYLYWKSQGEFIDELWAVIVLAIGSFGAFLSLAFAVYVIYKVFKRALGKRYVGLGLGLLSSLIVLYLTVMPFVFSPSEVNCGLRYFLPGLSYTLCFAIILVKLMSLQNYRLIGLGGEVSGVNQFLTVFFIVGVQIAVSVQWWVHNGPYMHSKLDSFGVPGYACNFIRQDFAACHAYVLLLIIICCIYAVGVRKEKKNMGEAKLLLACSWACFAMWVTWLPCFFTLDEKWSDVIICASILSCATAILLIIFVPKIRMVSRLRYDLSQKVNVRNGHSVDTDFLYERPYSLPGTLTSTFSSAKMSYPKTFSNFDADVNY